MVEKGLIYFNVAFATFLLTCFVGEFEEFRKFEKSQVINPEKAEINK